MFSKLLLRFNILVVFISFLTYLAPYVNIKSLWPVSLLALFYPFLLLANILLIGWWLFKKKKAALLSIIWLFAGWGHFSTLVGTHLGKEAATKSSIGVLSYNCRSFTKDNKRTNPVALKEFYNFLNEEEIKIACFQEFPFAKDKKRTKAIDEIVQNSALKYFYNIPNSGLLIMSSYPIKGVLTHHFRENNRSNGFQYADLTLGKNRIVRLFNIHLQTNAVTRSADKLAKKENYQDKETWLTIRGMLGKYRHSAITRIEQAKEIQKEIQNSPYPVIVCGDFNDVPLSRTYNLLRGKLRDGFVDAGSGLGITFAESIPGLKIDYILFSDELESDYSCVYHKFYSDHYPIYCRLNWLEKEANK